MAIKKMDISLKELRKILNKDGESYSDSEIEKIFEFISHWAIINAKTIIKKQMEKEKKKSY